MNSTHARILNVLFIGHDMSCTDQLTERDLRNSRLVHSLSLSLSLCLFVCMCMYAGSRVHVLQCNLRSQ